VIRRLVMDISEKVENPANRSNATADLVDIYKLYVERIKKHYDLRLEHFKIYLGFNSGLILVAGYLLKLYLESNEGVLSSAFLFKVISIAGIVFSTAWCRVARSDRKDQLVMNKILGDVEKEILENKRLGLYIRINEIYPPERKYGVDVIDINVYMSFFFILIWTLVLIYLCLCH
jgi:hypothetical protein